MRFINWKVKLGVLLIALSAGLYGAHYLVFRDAHHIFLYLLGDIAFIPVEVLLVTLIIHRIMSMHEKRAMMNKMNMVIGTFYSEVGTGLLKLIAGFDSGAADIAKGLIPGKDWSDADFLKAQVLIKGYTPRIESAGGDLNQMRDFLVEKRRFLLALLDNPILLEHESFTDLLWAVFHLSEELANRKSVCGLSDKDCEHLSGDIKRSYLLLVFEWLAYMRHLKSAYPYLFSLAARMNPFDEAASVEIR